METGYRNSTELLSASISEGLYRELVWQLRKDFELANISTSLSNVEYPEKLKPAALISLLQEKIYVLLMERFSDYLNLLYVVDVPERNFKDIPITDAVELSREIAFLILKREWQKVLLKRKYS
ncbi:hypothetical protein [Poritiphilus flavus]|uniref:Uncharacterized protein n=1 Tax=Poritiphilus flavus TaxID=2697053 RepID=A0A6L9E6Z3_9FLAO|nr:hypothetical protein [Poritiphilus flavus]NAS10411.1 hypothetical protein [Poritiphilus flavus]